MLRRKLYRDLWHYKGQFFTIFLMVFIGMLAFSGIHGYMDGMDESAKEYYKNANLQDLWITNTNVSDSDLNDLKSLDHVRDVNRALVLNAKLKRYKDVTLETNILEENTISKMHVVKGEKYASNKKGVWFDSYLAEYLNIHVGDTLELDVSGKILKLKVNGLVNTPDHVYFVKDSTEIFPTHQNYGFVYMSAQTFQDAMHVDVTYNKAYVDVDTQSHVSSVKKEIQKDFDFISVTDRDTSFSYAGYQAEVEEGQTYAPVFTGLFLMIAILSVMSTMNRFVRQQRVQIGTLKALGFKNRGVKINKKLYVLNHTKAPAMLIECCFVDDKDDVALYDFKSMASAIVYGITGQQYIEPSNNTSDDDAATSGSETSVGDKDSIYRVQVGAYRNKANAIALQEKLKSAGFDAAIVKA